MKYGLATLVMNLIFALGETLIFVIGYQLLTLFFDKELPQKGYILSSFHSEIFITVLLVFLCSHVMALLISSLVGESEITSVILAVVAGIAQFSLSGTILQLPRGIKQVDHLIFLGYGHKLFGMSNGLKTIPSAMASYHIPIDKNQLHQFSASHATAIGEWWQLGLHILVYVIVFLAVLRYKKESS